MSGPLFWRFAVVEEEGDERLFSALGVSDFFVAHEARKAAWREFWLLGCAATSDGWEKRNLVGWPGNIEVVIIDRLSRSIGSYYVGGSSIKGIRRQGGDRALVDIRLSGFFHRVPTVGAEGLWEDRRQGVPLEVAEWKVLSEIDRIAWLEVARIMASSSQGVDDLSGKTFVLDGEVIADSSSFYCAFGELVNGPAGYFGSDVNSLADCLSGGFGVVPPFTVAWKASSHSATLMGDDFDEITALFTERGVNLILE
ncbi:barstar family protein [Amycolatopsis sp. NPDC051071]|uniref:barstar family protein n=1 Tax=Amycolatopsis sp. NPDC051071 TaxID=3154637 RepID=UPI00343BCAAC